ncbi:hypothetical protein PHET_04780 [Paragonimus heterotremus]|uniref:Uncharacterized protein n=1 Tax=Paragonimus heterotremus TaxID=100268 RepID=A0A8J4TFX4_9TREM|nr:hypothetical protein PHET_04780 [Paragonimus heterotremus]
MKYDIFKISWPSCPDRSSAQPSSLIYKLFVGYDYSFNNDETTNFETTFCIPGGTRTWQCDDRTANICIACRLQLDVSRRNIFIRRSILDADSANTAFVHLLHDRVGSADCLHYVLYICKGPEDRQIHMGGREPGADRRLRCSWIYFGDVSREFK